MKYFLIFIMSIGSIAFANDPNKEISGLVRIRETKPVEYDSKTGAIISDSQNTVLKIIGVKFDNKIPGRVALLTDGQGQYDAVLVEFDDVSTANTIPQKFGKYLYDNKGFQINVKQEDLELDTTTFLSILKIEAKNLLVYSKDKKRFLPLKINICPLEKNKVWLIWGKSRVVPTDCL